MQNRVYTLEDPPEHVINYVPQVFVSNSTVSPPVLKDTTRQVWNVDGLLGSLGPVVAYERPDGSMALSTWMGETHKVWARFDVSPLPALVDMRQHMVEAVSIDLPRPEGFIRVICFARKAS